MRSPRRSTGREKGVGPVLEGHSTVTGQSEESHQKNWSGRKTVELGIFESQEGSVSRRVLSVCHMLLWDLARLGQEVSPRFGILDIIDGFHKSSFHEGVLRTDIILGWAKGKWILRSFAVKRSAMGRQFVPLGLGLDRAYLCSIAFWWEWASHQF